jgi:hypothetical protein
MASDGVSVKIPVTSLVQVSQVPTAATVQDAGGKALPPSGKALAAAAAMAAASANATAASATPVAVPIVNKAPTSGHTDAQSIVTLLNKFLNDSGRPNQYRVDPSSNDKLIQEINPATGAVIGEFAASEFPALARSVGVPGIIVDSHA